VSARAQAAVFDWLQGPTRLAATKARERIACERVIEAVMAELRRRMGQDFSVDELAGCYANASDWFLPLALAASPRGGPAHDEAVTLDTAFARFMRRARDASLW